MLINALCEYADLKADSSKKEGWEEIGVHYNIILSAEGEIADIVDIRIEQTKTDKKGNEKTELKPRKVLIPKRTQKPGIDSNYIEHRPLYIFGLNYDKDSGKLTPEDKTDKAKKSHAAFVKHELEFMDNLDSEICTAYRRFAEKWQPENETENKHLIKLGKDYQNSYFTFSLGIGREYLGEDKQLSDKYDSIMSSRSAESDVETAVCGILGKKLPIARLHDKIKFPGGQASGCQLVCMNGDAFESYGKSQSYNSNVSEEAMKKYTSVFNYLLSDEKHHIKLGDMTVVFFAMKENDNAECDWFFQGIEETQRDNDVDSATEAKIQTILEHAEKGKKNDENALSEVDENCTFFIAGFTPNASRISQKFIYRNKYGEIIRNLQKHQNDLRIREESTRSVYFYGIEKELVSPKASSDKVPPPLMTNIFLAAINNTPYPNELLSTVVRRVKTDSDEEKNHFIKLNDTRAGIIKACLNRKHKKEEITMAWNDENKNPAYLCGGLFAVFEKLQQESSGGNLNSTIKDSYFSSACSKPASVFPKLTKLANNHLKKLKYRDKFYVNIIQNIINEFDGKFPSTLDLDNQGRFIVGYYQMRQGPSPLYREKNTDEELPQDNMDE